jgi:hypothetical protein
MNVVKILLVLGLGYVALNQKVVKTRNMLLVVTGLLAFCMFSVEGFTVTLDSKAIFTNGDNDDNTVTTGSGANQIVYTLPANGDYDSSQAIPATGYSCTIGEPGAPGNIGKYTGADVYDDSNNQVPPDNVDITKIFTCEAATTACPSTAPATDQCGTGYQYKATTGVNYTGAVGGDDYNAKCCEPTPTSPMPNCGENAECSLSIFGDAAKVADDGSNKCSDAFYEMWSGTCNCTGSGTWTKDTGGGNGCSASS